MAKELSGGSLSQQHGPEMNRGPKSLLILNAPNFTGEIPASETVVGFMSLNTASELDG